MTVVILDTETTGFLKPVHPVEVAMIELDGDDPRYFVEQKPWSKLFNPGKPIECGAMSTHFITNEMLEDATPWDPCQMPQCIDIYIGHSIDYDWEAVGSPAEVKRICTFAMAKRMWPDADSHKLTALLIHVLGPKEALPLIVGAHRAEVDAGLTVHLLRAIIKEWDISTWDELYEISETCREPTHMTFGKYGPDKSSGYKGMPIHEMIKTDRQYVTNFLLQKVDDLDPYLRKVLMRELES